MNQYLFIHIPRTSGSKFVLNIGPFVGEVAPWNNWLHYLNGDGEFSQYNLFGGHIDYNALKLFQDHPRTITILRNPIERAISHYNHLKCNTPGKKTNGIMDRNTTFNEFIENPRSQLLISNLQTRTIGCHYMPEIYRAIPEDEIPFWMERYLKTEPEDLTRAKQRLQTRLFFFGLKERQADSYRLFNALTGLDVPLPGEHHRKYNLPRATINKLRDLNELDLELYECAHQLFEENLCLFT